MSGPGIFDGTRFASMFGAKESTTLRNAALAQQEAEVPKSPFAKRFKWVWLVAALLTFFIPLATRTLKMNGSAEWNNQAAQQGQDQDQGPQFYDVNNCKWYNFNCQSQYVDDKGEYVSEYAMQQELNQYKYDQQQQQYEQNQEQNQNGQNGNWNNGWNYNRNYERQQNANNQDDDAILFVYLWETAMFIGIVAYGLNVIATGKSMVPLMMVLLVWFQFNFLSMLILRSGAIETEGREVEDMGYYRQLSVLVYMTSTWYVIHGAIFTIVCFFMNNQVSAAPSQPAADAGDYKAYESPAGESKAVAGEGDFVKVI